ncbi:MAG: acetyl-CoA hydrolase/transferase family protein [Deltaproteobacteria bacterium]|nr:acetyl-CoA hydrolase/transferase family protein [Deltaproteobacteria bacterium]
MTDRRISLDNWQEELKRKTITPEEAVKLIKSGDNIFIPSTYLGGIPRILVERAAELRDVTVEIQAPLNDPGWLSPGMEDSFTIIPRIYLAPTAREAHDEGRVTFLPYTNGTWFKLYRDGRPIKRDIDVLLVEVSLPDKNGFMTFGANVWERPMYARRAKKIIAELDPNAIRAHGDTHIHVSQVDHIVDMSADAFTREEMELLLGKIPAEVREQAQERFESFTPRRLRNFLERVDEIDPERLIILFGGETADGVSTAIARNLKPLIRDGDTIQIGIGHPSRFIVELGVFDDANDLTIFSEMACPEMGFLVKRGIATGKYATLHPGKAVFGALTGMTRDEIDWADDNPLIEQYSVDYVVNIGNIIKQKNMLAINNATQIDLTGQITCETQFGPRMINGPGGQIEFQIGAFSAPGGRAVTLLVSTWGDGGISTIVPQLEQGSLVTIPRSYADYIVTEWGVAELAGKTHMERAEALIEIAHPDFQDELREAAKDIY